ncbi:hypothetical protein E0Z10_g8794 [Xylaria hypoxylon]|uniref:FAD-binding PCMH-type domain-containing protein n=1 Tax=Xylaria hypoxylon TaxID=37992 RepID=A0A4Z0YLZ9_9PEZI|nr:hypothetical protein E0Z10_g8794 [Xylaria hypoxylon]
MLRAYQSIWDIFDDVTTYDADECKRPAEINNDNAYRQSLPAGVMYTNPEQISEIGCPVLDANDDGLAPDPVDAECTLGTMPSYVVDVTSTAQVAEAVKFAAEHNLRLRIKNSGHDYSGRSSGAGALSIWTRHLTTTEAVSSFVPESCEKGSSHDVGAENRQVTIGGYTTTVGAAAYVLGGGGGAFGVTTRIWLKSYPALPAVNTVSGSVGCKDYESYSRLISNFVDNTVALCDLGHFGIWESAGAQLGMTLVNIIPYLSEEDIKTANETLADVQAVTAFIDVRVFGPWSGTTVAQNETNADADRNMTAAYGTTQYYNKK